MPWHVWLIFIVFYVAMGLNLARELYVKEKTTVLKAKIAQDERVAEYQRLRAEAMKEGRLHPWIRYNTNNLSYKRKVDGSYIFIMALIWPAFLLFHTAVWFATHPVKWVIKHTLLRPVPFELELAKKRTEEEAKQRRAELTKQIKQLEYEYDLMPLDPTSPPTAPLALDHYVTDSDAPHPFDK
jgi:hypothetical protein